MAQQLPHTSVGFAVVGAVVGDRKSTRLNSSHEWNSYAVFCVKTKRVGADERYCAELYLVHGRGIVLPVTRRCDHLRYVGVFLRSVDGSHLHLYPSPAQRGEEP